MSSESSIKVAIIQHPPVFLNLEASLEKAEALIEEAANQDAQIIAFGETWLCGYPVWFDYAPSAALWDHPPAKALYRILTDNALEIPSPHLDRLRDAAACTDCTVVMGAHERAGGTLYNTIVTINPQREYIIHRKLVPTYTERLVWGRGDGSMLGVMDTPYGALGSLVCWEHWMPLTRAAMHNQHEVIHVAQWPSVKDLHQLASRHYAFEGQCFVLAAGSILSKGQVLEGFDSLGLEDNPALELLESIPGDDTACLMNGGSAVIAPDSTYITEPVFDQEAIIYAEINPTTIADGHMTMDTTGHYSRPDVFHLQINDQPQTGLSYRSKS